MQMVYGAAHSTFNKLNKYQERSRNTIDDQLYP